VKDLLLDHKTTLSRVLTPRWSFDPLSGAGAARDGGRFNRPGVEAVYLSLDPATALAEYQQDSPFLPPGTIASYLANARVADLAGALPTLETFDPAWVDWNVDWRHFAFFKHIEPPTWSLGDLVLEEGLHGILFPSTVAPGGLNVVLFPTTFQTVASLEVLDPHHALPHDQSSWK
jgi:RES domain-containing protein